MSTLNHPCVINPKGIFLEDETVGFVSPPMLGDVESFVRGKLSNDKWDVTKKSICLYGIMSGMAYLHSQKIVHRDLGLSHVYLNHDLEPVIYDMEVSRFIGADMTYCVGSPIYMAPETFADSEEDKSYDEKVDVYSFAVLLYRMYTGDVLLDDSTIPVSTPRRLLRRVLNGARLVRKPEIPDKHWELITACWNHKPEERPSFAELVKAFKDSPELYAFEGTNMDELQAYIAKLEGSSA